jgi:uncharacterized protein (DUF305 family)
MPFRITLRTSLRGSLAVAAALAVTGLTGCSSNDMSTMPGMDHGSSGSPSATSSPAATGTPAAGPHNDADVMFAQAMIPHHQQAVAKSDMMVAKDDIDAKVSDLATQIKAAQGPEIAQMSGWLAGWGENPSPSTGMDHDMGGGMMSQADMDALDQATECAKRLDALPPADRVDRVELTQQLQQLTLRLGRHGRRRTDLPAHRLGLLTADRLDRRHGRTPSRIRSVEGEATAGH